MGNLAVIKIFQIIKFPKDNNHSFQKYLFMADEYYRIKICRFPEIYDIISIWIPFEYVAKSLVNFSNKLLILFKSEEENTPGKYKICSIDRKDIENQDFICKEIKFEAKYRKNEKTKMFLINEEKNEFGILSQYEIEKNIKVELDICSFDEKDEKINFKRNFTFETSEKVKLIKSNRDFIVLAGKTITGENQEISIGLKRVDIQKDVELYENNLVKFFCIHLR